jgi:hypothetical protein
LAKNHYTLPPDAPEMAKFISDSTHPPDPVKGIPKDPRDPKLLSALLKSFAPAKPYTPEELRTWNQPYNTYAQTLQNQMFTLAKTKGYNQIDQAPPAVQQQMLKELDTNLKTQNYPLWHRKQLEDQMLGSWIAPNAKRYASSIAEPYEKLQKLIRTPSAWALGGGAAALGLWAYLHHQRKKRLEAERKLLTPQEQQAQQAMQALQQFAPRVAPHSDESPLAGMQTAIRKAAAACARP